jgi:hypothetical protein
MSYYLKNLLNESEMKRILNLHENRKKYEWKGLIMEATQEEAKVFFDKRRTKMKNFPPNGTIIDYDGKGNFVYQITGTDGKPLYLFADGTAKDSVGNTAANRWYGQLSSDEVALDKMTTLKPTQVGSKFTDTKLQPLGTQPKSALDTQNLASGSELRQQGREQKRMLKRANKQQRKDDKQAKQNCTKYYQNYSKLSKNMKDSQKLQYETYLNTCCDVLEMNFTGLPFCQAQGTVTPVLPKETTVPTQTNQMPDSEMNPNK